MVTSSTMGAVCVFSDIQSFCEKKPDTNRFKSQETLFKGGQAWLQDPSRITSQICNVSTIVFRTYQQL